MPPQQRFEVRAAAGDHHCRQDDHDRRRRSQRRGRPGTRCASSGSADDRGDRSDADDDRRAHHVGEPLERDGGGGLAGVDAIGEQHDLQRLAGDAAQGEVAERFGGEPHAGEPEEADRARLREAPRPRPRARQVPQAAEEQRERQREAEPPDRPDREVEVDVVERGEEQDDAEARARPSGPAVLSCGSPARAQPDQQALGVLQIRDGVDVVPGGVADVDRAHQPARGQLADAAAQRRVAVPRETVDARRTATARRRTCRCRARRIRSAPCRSRRSGRLDAGPSSPRPRRRPAPAASRPRAATRPRRLRCRSSRASTARLEQVIAHQQGEAAIGEAHARAARTDTPFSRCQSGLYEKCTRRPAGSRSLRCVSRRLSAS